MMKNYNNRKAFSLTEIIIATVVFVAIFTALSLLTSSTRTDTSKSINYLRALQIAQEAVDWVNSAPFSEVTDTNIAFLRGSLVDPSSNNSVEIMTAPNGKSSIEKLKYPDDYSKCFYYRTVEIDKLDGIPNNRFLKKITVGVYWNEGKMPKNIETASKEPDRMRKLFLSTIIFNEKEYY